MNTTPHSIEIQPTGYKRVLSDLLGIHSTCCYRLDHLIRELEALFSLVDTLESSSKSDSTVTEQRSTDIVTHTSSIKDIIRSLVLAGDGSVTDQRTGTIKNENDVLKRIYEILGHVSTIARDAKTHSKVMFNIESIAVHCADIAQNLEFNTISGLDAASREHSVRFAERAADILLCVCWCPEVIGRNETNKREIDSALARLRHSIELSSIISTNTPFIYRQDATFLTRFHVKSALAQLIKSVPAEGRNSLIMIERAVNFYCAALDYYADLRLYKPAVASRSQQHLAVSLNVFEGTILTKTLIKKLERFVKDSDASRSLVDQHLTPAVNELEEAFHKALEQNNKNPPCYDSVNCCLNDARIKLENIRAEHIDNSIVAVIDKIITCVLRTIDITDEDIPVHSSIWNCTKTSLPLFPFEAPKPLPSLENISEGNVDNCTTLSFSNSLRQHRQREEDASDNPTESRVTEPDVRRSNLIETDSANTRQRQDGESAVVRQRHPAAVHTPRTDVPPQSEKTCATQHKCCGAPSNLPKTEYATTESAHTKKDKTSNIKKAITFVWNMILSILKGISRIVERVCSSVVSCFPCEVQYPYESAGGRHSISRHNYAYKKIEDTYPEEKNAKVRHPSCSLEEFVVEQHSPRTPTRARGTSS